MAENELFACAFQSLICFYFPFVMFVSFKTINKKCLFSLRIGILFCGEGYIIILLNAHRSCTQRYINVTSKARPFSKKGDRKG